MVNDKKIILLKIIFACFIIPIQAMEDNIKKTIVNPVISLPIFFPTLRNLDIRKPFEIEYLCEDTDCPEGFKTRKEARLHYSKVHIFTELLLKCQSECLHRQSFDTEEKLWGHLKRVHDKKFHCDFKCPGGECSSSFGMLADLARHKRQVHKLNIPIRKIKQSKKSSC